MYNSLDCSIGSAAFSQFYPSYYNVPAFSMPVPIPNPYQLYLHNCPQTQNLALSPERESNENTSEVKKEESQNGTLEENMPT